MVLSKNGKSNIVYQYIASGTNPFVGQMPRHGAYLSSAARKQ